MKSSISPPPDEGSGNFHFANSKLSALALPVEVRSAPDYAEGARLQLKGCLYIPFGIIAVVFVLQVILREVLFESYRSDDESVSGLYLVLAGLLVVAMALIRHAIGRNPVGFALRTARLGRRYRADAATRLSTDARDPVLYLRSFIDDPIENDVETANNVETENFEPGSMKTFEEYESRVLEDIGPVLAIGRPGEKLPLLGATRVYVNGDNWQTIVKGLFRIATLVVAHAGVSAGLLWEIETFESTANPSNLLISFFAWQSLDQDTRQTQYARFRKCANGIFKGKLPERIGKADYMMFDPRWTPCLIATTRWQRIFYNRSRTVLLRKTLQQFATERNLNIRQGNRFLDLALMTCVLAGLIAPWVLFFASLYGWNESALTFWVLLVPFIAVGYAWLIGTILSFLLKGLAMLPTRGSGLEPLSLSDMKMLRRKDSAKSQPKDEL